MAQGRYRARCERGEVDAEVGQAKKGAQWTLFTALHLGCERLWIVGRFDALGGVDGDKGDGGWLVWHD